MARAGGQIFRDVLRRKLNAENDLPNYDDQGGELSWKRLQNGDSQPMVRQGTRVNPDGTFDGPSGGYPKGDYHDEADDYMGDMDADQMRAYEEDFEAEDRMDREAGRLTGPELAKIQGRLLKAGETADGGDQAIVDAVAAEAERMGAEGVPLDDLLSLAGSIADPYSTGDEKQTRAMLQQAYQRGASKAKNNMNKNMGKPFR